MNRTLFNLLQLQLILGLSVVCHASTALDSCNAILNSDPKVDLSQLQIHYLSPTLLEVSNTPIPHYISAWIGGFYDEHIIKLAKSSQAPQIKLARFSYVPANKDDYWNYHKYLKSYPSERLKHELLDFVYNRYTTMKTVKAHEVEDLVKIDSKLNPLRTNYVFLTDGNQNTKFALRIYDGSENALLPGTHSEVPLPTDSKTDSSKLPIQFEYPSLKIDDLYKVELGRAAKNESAVENLHRMFFLTGLWIFNSYKAYLWSKMVIYAECTEKMLNWYVIEHRFTVHAGSAMPEDPTLHSRLDPNFQLIPSMKGEENRYILKMKGEKFMDLYIH